MSNFSSSNIDFCRQALLQRITRPLAVIALYPQNSSDTTLSVLVTSNATVIAIRYVSSSTVNESVSFVDRSVSAVVQEINKLNLPIRAVALSNIDILKQGDIVETGSTHKAIPNGFNIYDRVTDRGITLRAKRIAVRHKNNSKIKVLIPHLEDASLPWYPRISNGAFSQKYDNKIYHFYIPEFDRQAWSTTFGKPFKDLRGVEPVLIDGSRYQLPRFPVYWNGENITLYNGDVPLSQNIIQDIDVNNGLLYIRPEVFIDDDFTIDYSYLETSYVYKDINVNGHFTQNPLLLDKFVVFYLLPIEGNLGISKRTVYHVIGDSIEHAINSISLDDASIPIAIIGAYNIQQVFASDKVSILDTRSKGGGLKQGGGPTSPVHYLDSPIEDTSTPIEALYKESSRFWDIANIDGEPYPGAAAIAIDLPLELQEVLSISDIKKRATKFVAAGVFPVLNFSDRALPAITGLSSQVSCAVNLDLGSVIETTDVEGIGGIFDSIPATFTGGGWIVEDYLIPRSIYTGNWDSVAPLVPIKNVDNTYVLEINTTTGLRMPYLKSTSIAGISWDERQLIISSGSVNDFVSYTPWEKKLFYDIREAPTGQLIKGYLSLDPNYVTKQYKNIKIHSPFLSGEVLKDKLENSISSILDKIFDLQVGDGSLPNGTEITRQYATVEGTSTVEYSDYVLSPELYNNIYNLEDTPLEDRFYTELFNIGEDLLASGIQNQGHFFKFFIQNIGQYVNIQDVTTSPASIEYNNPLKILNKYLDFRHRKNVWSGDCDLGRLVSTGLINTLMNSSGVYGEFGPGIPTVWSYIPNLETLSSLSGYYIPTNSQLGGGISEIGSDFTVDYLYNNSLPAFISSTLSLTGNNLIDSSTLSVFLRSFNITLNETLDNINSTVNETRTLSGLPTTTHWFVGHNRLGTYLGNTVKNLIDSYEYLARYNKSRTSILDITTPTGASVDFLNQMFSGIEKTLDVGYSSVYHNLLRGGITEPDLALTLYGYGWYLNNWKENYGIRSKIYVTDKRSTYAELFSDGLKQLIKNQFTEEGDLLETSTVHGDVGPFPVSTPSKILYPIGEALKYDYENWKGIAQGVINTIVNNYSNSGLYYSNPYKQSKAPGKESDVLGGLSAVYKSIASTGQYTLWEPVDTELSNIRGANFLPTFPTRDELPPTGNWQGNVNSLSFWKYYHSGDIETGIAQLKSYGINTLRVALDLPYWKYNRTSFYEKFDHLLSSCIDQRMRVIPVLLQGVGQLIPTGQELNYVNTFGHTGGPYAYSGVSSSIFMTGFSSGELYTTSLISSFDRNPAILAWDITHRTNRIAQAAANYNAIAFQIKQQTDTPVIVSIDTNITHNELVGVATPAAEPLVFEEEGPYGIAVYGTDSNAMSSLVANSNIDFIGLTPSPLDSLFTELLTDKINKTPLLSSFGNGTYGDYELAIDKAEDNEIPYVLSNLYVRSGSEEGALYYNNTARSSRQLSAIINSARRDGVLASGVPTQRRSFNGYYFYASGYTPSYTSVDLINEITDWGSRVNSTPLNTSTGEFVRQISVLTTAQSGLDTLNYKLWSQSYYSVPEALTINECDFLNYYRNTWSSGNFLAATGNTWLISGAIDKTRYHNFLDTWGTFLGTVSIRLELNG